jgi:glycogen operon protein
MLATLILSQGAPMLLAGDEIGHTQRGNNNAYCQDNEISWLNWDLEPEQESLLKFARVVTALFAEQPVLHRRRFFHGQAIQGEDAPEIAWLDPTGVEMSKEAWNTADVRCLGVELFGGNMDVDEHGEAILGDSMLLLFNADHANTIPFNLPPPIDGGPWELVFDTANESNDSGTAATDIYQLQPCSMVVLLSRLNREEDTI